MQSAVVHVPLDGGYGWVVTLSAFMVGLILDGISFSFGLFYNEFLEYFRESKAKTAWVGSVYNGMYMTIGPIVSFLCDRYGCRRVSMAGGVLACVACLCAVFSNSVGLLILTYGFFGGFGFGMMYLPALVMVGQYFERRRALATGIAVCGSGVGGFVFAYLVEFLIDTFTWRGATLIIAGIALNGTVFGALLRPLEATVLVVDDPPTPPLTELAAPPTEDDDSADDDDASDRRPPQAAAAAAGPRQEFYLSLPDWHAAAVAVGSRDISCGVATTTTAAAVGSQPLLLNLQQRRQPQGQKPGKRRRRLLHIDVARPKFRSVSSLAGASVGSSAPNLDALRDEILVALEADAMASATAAGGSAPSKSSADLKERLHLLCREALKSLRLLQGNPALLIYGATCFLCMAGFYIPFTYIPVYAKSLSLHGSAPQDLISVIGWVNLVSRLLIGWVGDRSWADCLLINGLSLVIGGVGTGLFVLYRSFPLLVMACIIFGSCIAIFVALRSIIGVELVGINNLSEAFGFIILCQGLSTFIGTPLAGLLADVTGDTVSTFYFAGAAILLSGLLCLPLRRVAAWKSTAAQKKQQQQQQQQRMDDSA